MALRRSRNSERALTDMVTRYRSPSAFEFTTEQCADVATGGMFVRTGAPPPAGTLLKVECDPRLEGECESIRGVGRVVWTRTATDPPLGPTGMGIKFVKLDPGSEALIRRVLDEQGSSLDPHGEQRRLSGSPEDQTAIRKAQAGAADAPEPQADEAPGTDHGQKSPGPWPDLARAPAEAAAFPARNPGPLAEPAPVPRTQLRTRRGRPLLLMVLAAIAILGAAVAFQRLRSTRDGTPAAKADSGPTTASDPVDE